MTRIAEVRLRWLVGHDASNHSPRGQKLSLPARFDHQDEKDWMHNAWSLVVDVEDLPDAQGHQVGRARFLVPNAPQEWLSVGAGFTLLEGNLAVAVGKIEKLQDR